MPAATMQPPGAPTVMVEMFTWVVPPEGSPHVSSPGNLITVALRLHTASEGLRGLRVGERAGDENADKLQQLSEKFKKLSEPAKTQLATDVEEQCKEAHAKLEAIVANLEDERSKRVQLVRKDLVAVAAELRECWHSEDPDESTSLRSCCQSTSTYVSQFDPGVCSAHTTKVFQLSRILVRGACRKASGVEDIEVVADEDVRQLGFVPTGIPPGTVKIKKLQTGGWAFRQDLRVGDELLGVNGASISSLMPTKEDLSSRLQERPLRLSFVRYPDGEDCSGSTSGKTMEASDRRPSIATSTVDRSTRVAAKKTATKVHAAKAAMKDAMMQGVDVIARLQKELLHSGVNGDAVVEQDALSELRDVAAEMEAGGKDTLLTDRDGLSFTVQADINVPKLGFATVESTFQIRLVDPSGWADAQGVQPGDVLLLLDEDMVDDLTTKQLVDRLRNRRPLKLTFLRPGVRPEPPARDQVYTAACLLAAACINKAYDAKERAQARRGSVQSIGFSRFSQFASTSRRSTSMDGYEEQESDAATSSSYFNYTIQKVSSTFSVTEDDAEKTHQQEGPITRAISAFSMFSSGDTTDNVEESPVRKLTSRKLTSSRGLTGIDEQVADNEAVDDADQTPDRDDEETRVADEGSLMHVISTMSMNLFGSSTNAATDAAGKDQASVDVDARPLDVDPASQIDEKNPDEETTAQTASPPNTAENTACESGQDDREKEPDTSLENGATGGGFFSMMATWSFFGNQDTGETAAVEKEQAPDGVDV